MGELFRKYRALLLTIAILIASIASMYANHTPEDERNAFEDVVVWLSSPLQKAVVYVWDGAGGIWSDYVDVLDAKQESNDCDDLLSHSKMRLSELKEVEHENTRLRRMLGFKNRHPNNYLPARIISTDILGQFRSVTINVGSDDGVLSMSPVVNQDGVVGRVYAVLDRTSKVLLIIDQNSSVDGLVSRTRSRGIIQGDTQDDELSCKFAYSLRTEDIAVGDIIVTSGIDRGFPPGLPLGTVKEVFKGDTGIFQDALVQPLVDFRCIEEVMVILPPEDLR